MSYDPSIVGRYGNLVEIWAAGKYPIERDYPVVDGLKFDNRRSGRPAVGCERFDDERSSTDVQIFDGPTRHVI